MEDVQFEWMAAGFQRTFYYDALPVQKDREDSATYEQLLSSKRRCFSRINQTPYMHTREGITRNRLTSRTRQQKGVDILLAIDVFKHASLGNLSEAHIMTTDLDFFPLFEALRDTPVSVHLHCLCDETSEELMSLADVVRPVTPFTVLQWAQYQDRNAFAARVSEPEQYFRSLPMVKKGSLQGLPLEIFQGPPDLGATFVGRWNGEIFRSKRWEHIVADLEHRQQKRVIFSS